MNATDKEEEAVHISRAEKVIFNYLPPPLEYWAFAIKAVAPMNWREDGGNRRREYEVDGCSGNTRRCQTGLCEHPKLKLRILDDDWWDSPEVMIISSGGYTKDIVDKVHKHVLEGCSTVRQGG